MQPDPSLITVIRMARVGMPHHHIAFVLGISPLELRSRYSNEMRRAEIEANFQIWDTLFHMAKSGKSIAATIFWLKTRAGATTSTKSTHRKHEEEAPYRDPPVFRIVDRNGNPYQNDDDDAETPPCQAI